jgi:CHAD domain-containing protein
MLEQETTARGRARRKQFQLVKTKLHEQRTETAAAVKGFLEKIDIALIGSRLGVRPPPNDAVNSGQLELDSIGETEPNNSLALIDDRSVAAYAADRLDQRLEEFLDLAAQAHPTADPADLHQLRIAAKRVRYLLEIVSQMGFGDASTALAWLRVLQDRIGDWHDLEALEEEIISIVSEYEFLKEHLDECSDMLQAASRLQKKKARLVSRLFPVRVPKHLVTTSQRIARALRRHAAREQPSTAINA